ncbi:MAG: [FeFe] hydrogenase H-cluster radical SAM maturase HydE [Bacteroides sp.]|nr:[FeFe] hydrogenase H-cluster radical SAM maturase HydE [Roseburia sp.]MCM1346741.1 [FeFe] hydrogenase H-cluster radical SAM maturase HydE [Bacteroides sp.]MCM1420181.1 [FeFe] hydrogenase H-cluster radical SAM maturase HydE [Bacteroides sp.]
MNRTECHNVGMLVSKLVRERVLAKEEYVYLISKCSADLVNTVSAEARKVAEANFGHKILLRGLLEISNYCRNGCRYCGLRCPNHDVKRYRMSREQILERCRYAYTLGLRTFVLQGGEDSEQTDEWISSVVRALKSEMPDAAVTLSVGERSHEGYCMMREAGADRYLLRHEAVDETLYAQLHPVGMSLPRRIECLYELKRLGFQTGTGFMVGVPFQTAGHIADDLLFIHKLQPEMIGIGPFIAAHGTPFENESHGSLELTLLLIGILRLMFPTAHIPSTTALATLSPEGRLRGILAGANVVMPNISPAEVRDKYSIYDGKAAFGAECAEGIRLLEEQLVSIGYRI